MKSFSPYWYLVPCLGLTLTIGGCQVRHAARGANSLPTAPSRLAVKAAPRVLSRPALRPSAHIVPGIVTRRNVFALTFDDGPDPQWTPQVLAILKKWHTPATFFMVGQMVRAHPHVALLVKAAKSPIGNHTWSHPLAPRSPQSEVERTDAILQAVLGVKPTLFRPPYGILDNGLTKVALSRGEDVIGWTLHGSDWDKHATAHSITTKVLQRARPGGIALLHDGGGNRSQTVAALPFIIDGLRRRGYLLVTVPELLRMGLPLPLPTSESQSGFGISLAKSSKKHSPR